MEGQKRGGLTKRIDLPNVGDYIYVQVHSYSKLHVFEYKVRVTQIIEADRRIVAQGSNNHIWWIGDNGSRHKTWREASKILPKFVKHELGNMTYEQKVRELLER